MTLLRALRFPISRGVAIATHFDNQQPAYVLKHSHNVSSVFSNKQLLIVRNFSFQSQSVSDNLPCPSHQITRNTLCHQPHFKNETSERYFASSAGGSNNSEGERKLKDTIKKCFPTASNIIVEDISGGCGSMYQIYIEASEFKGLTTVKQHRLVNEALKQEIKSMHGIRIQTAVPKT